LAKDAVCADDLRRFRVPPAPRRRPIEVNEQQMVAKGVVGIFVATAELREVSRPSRSFLEKNLIAQPLRQLDLPPRARQSHFEIADSAVYLRLDTSRKSRRTPCRQHLSPRLHRARKIALRRPDLPPATHCNRLPHR